MTRTRTVRPAQRGFTLIELMAVVVIAGIVSLGLGAFYLNSQAMWMEASTQALAQRDATALVQLMRERSQSAAQAIVSPASADSVNERLTLYDISGTQTDGFAWNPADSMVHHEILAGQPPTWQDAGPVVTTIVERFSLSFDPALAMVSLDSLRVRSSNGQRVRITTAFALYNAP